MPAHGGGNRAQHRWQGWKRLLSGGRIVWGQWVRVPGVCGQDIRTIFGEESTDFGQS